MVLPTRRKAFQIAYGGGDKIYHLSSQYINKIVGYPKKSRPVPPSEGEQKHAKPTHLRKVGEDRWRRKRGYRRYRGARAITHLRKVNRKHGKTAHHRKVGEGCWRRKRGYRRHRGPHAITHLRKVSRKHGKYAHLRKVGEGCWRRKRGYRPYRGSRANCAPSEGEQKTRENCTPSEGEQKNAAIFL